MLFSKICLNNQLMKVGANCYQTTCITSEGWCYFYFFQYSLKTIKKDGVNFLIFALPRQNCRFVQRGSYMSAHVLLNLSNKFGKSDKMRGLPSILILFRNEFNKFNNTGARMLDSIYHMI